MMTWLAKLTDISNAWRAAFWYLVITIGMTWPLTPNVARDLPGDLGDPVFVCWVLARTADSWLALFSGDLGVLTRFWHSEMFHPEPWVTLYSEHLAAHALQILPVWVLTKNIIVCYNVLFLGSFVIGGTGMYLLTRELTGSARGAFVAGLMFMLAPYRFSALPHLQVLSSHWMPLVLFGLRRYFDTGRTRALAGCAGALLLQNLSSGYYLIYFGPLVALYAITEMWGRGLMARWRVWRDLIVTGLVSLALTLPFSLPYAILQRRYGYKRPIDEIQLYTADVLNWATAIRFMNVWGWLQALPRSEGFLFPGSMILVTAFVGVIAVVFRANASSLESPRGGSSKAIVTFALIGCVFAVWMAMGPIPTFAGRPLPIPSLYMVFYQYVPGFDVSRVPSRFMTLVLLCLAILAAYGTAWIDRSRRRWLLALVSVGVLLDGAALPLLRNAPIPTSTDVLLPESRMYPEKDAPPLWRYLKTLPADAVLAHLPFGYAEHELQYLYYSRIDGHRLSNGYSGGFPLSYQTRSAVLQRAIEMPAQAVARLREDGVNYVVVHTERWPGDVGMRTVMALEGAGLRPVTHLGTVYVLEVSR